MTADKPRRLVPKLRFPEFEEAPAWSIEPLGRLFHQRQETGFPELPLLSVTDRNGVVPQDETNRKSTASRNKAKYLRVVTGDIVYNTMRMWEGRSARVGMEGVVSPAYTVCRPSTDTNSHFFAHYFKTRPLIEQFRKYSQGLVKDTLNLKYEAFSVIPIGFPAPKEQQKIADCLDSLDDLIATERQKLQAARAHKQGLMQQLFPQPGETVPRRRFTEFRHAANWETKLLGNEGDFLSSLTGKTAKDFDTGDGVFIPYTNVFSNAFTSTTDLRSVNVADGETQTAVAKGDVFFTVSSENPEEAGMSSVLLEEIGNCYLNSFCALFRFDEGKSPDRVFLGYLLRSATARAHLSREAQGAIRYNIPRKAFRSLPILIPSRSEQKKIAGCLDPLDDVIAAEDGKIRALRKFKQGLMQHLFPSSEPASR